MTEQDGWYGAAKWLRNNYQAHANIASLCEAMEAAAPQPEHVRAEPVAPEDYSAFSNLAMLVKRLVHRYRQLDPHDPISADVLKFLRECGGMGTPFRAAPPSTRELVEALREARDHTLRYELALYHDQNLLARVNALLAKYGEQT